MCKSVNILVFRSYQCCPGALGQKEHESYTHDFYTDVSPMFFRCFFRQFSEINCIFQRNTAI